MNDLMKLFYIFCRIGGFTFGGGYAILPIIQKEIVEELKWATDNEVLDFYALAQCTPGIIAINTATFIGYKRKGILGGIAATLGMVFPSLVIITTIATFFYKFQEYTIVQHAFNGIKIGVVALIVFTVTKMWNRAVNDWKGMVIFIISFLVFSFLHLSPIIVIIAASLLGLIIYYNKQKYKTGDNQ